MTNQSNYGILLNISAVKQDSFQYHCYDIQGAVFCNCRAFLIYSAVGPPRGGQEGQFAPGPRGFRFL